MTARDCPSGKLRYASRRKAARDRKRLSRLYGDRYRPYQCELCHGWHLSTRLGKRERRG